VLTSIIVTNYDMTNDIPMYFRVRGTPDTSLVSGLVAYYPFDGDASDRSANGNDGVVHGAKLTIDRHGEGNKAYAFNIGEYIEVANSPSLESPTSQVTVAAWVRWDQWHGYGHNWGIVFDKGATACQYALDFAQYENKLLLNGNPDIRIPLPPSTLQPGAWYFLAITYDGVKAVAYINGLACGEVFHTGALPVNHENMTIGADVPGMTEYTIGAIDEVRIYNRALSTNDVFRLYNRP
jgi:hypothetical protein